MATSGFLPYHFYHVEIILSPAGMAVPAARVLWGTPGESLADPSRRLSDRAERRFRVVHLTRHAGTGCGGGSRGSPVPVRKSPRSFGAAPTERGRGGAQAAQGSLPSERSLPSDHLDRLCEAGRGAPATTVVSRSGFAGACDRCRFVSEPGASSALRHGRGHRDRS